MAGSVGGRFVIAVDAAFVRDVAGQVPLVRRGSVVPVTDPIGPDGGDTSLDLDEVARELDGVEVALERLDAGTDWTDEVTGERLPDELLEADPIARRLA